MERLYNSSPWGARKSAEKPAATSESIERTVTLADVELQLDRLDRLAAKSPETDAEYREEVVKRVERAKGSFLGGLSKNAAIGFLCLKVLGTLAPAAQEHIDTRDPITAVAEASLDPSEGTVYRHEDAETTEILNYLAGKGELSAETEAKIVRWKVEAAFARYGFTPPDGFQQADEQGIHEMLEQLYQRVQPSGFVSVEAFIDTHTRLPEQGMPHPELYHKLWELERKVGAPQIRWSFDAPDEMLVPLKAVRGQSGAEVSSTYVMNTNTIYLSPHDGLDGLVSEQSHAYQFHTAPFNYTFRNVRDMATTVARAFQTKMSIAESAYITYTRDKSSLEYEAHQIVEPQLQSELPGQDFTLGH